MSETVAEPVVQIPNKDLPLPQLIVHPALQLSPFEQEAARLWLLGWSEYEIYERLSAPEDAHELKPSERRRLEFDGKRRVRWALERVAEKVAKYRPVQDAGWEFARFVVQCVRNRQESGGPQDLIGLLPTIYLDDPEMTPAEYQKIVSEPKNYRNVVLRSPAMHAGMTKQKGRDSLRHLQAGLA